MNSITCPHCRREFECEPLEEIVNPTLKIERKSKEMSSWHDIADKIRSGHSYLLFNEGDTITCTLKNGKEVAIDVAGINIYGENQVVFCFRDCLDEDYCMNERSTNAGGYQKSKMLNSVDSITNLLPDDLVDVIKCRKITQNISGAVYEADCRLWIPSMVEVFGEKYRRYECEQDAVQLPIFKDPRRRIKHRMSATSDEKDTSIYWWLRSPVVGNSAGFWGVFYFGSTYSNYGGANSVGGVCPCFII